MSSSHTHPVLHGWRFRAMLLIVLLSAIGYLAFSLWGGWHEVVEALGKVGIIGTLIALALSLVNYLVRFVRWQKFLSKMGHAVYWPESLRICKFKHYAAQLGHYTQLPGLGRTAFGQQADIQSAKTRTHAPLHAIGQHGKIPASRATG